MNLIEWKTLHFPVADIEREEMLPRLIEVMDEYPRLNEYGMGVYGWRSKTPDERLEFMRENRARLLESVDDVVRCADWICRHMAPLRHPNLKHNSYGLKHIAEREIGYITNGVFIAAALVLNYVMRDDGGANPYFGMSEESIKRAYKASRNEPRS